MSDGVPDGYHTVTVCDEHPELGIRAPSPAGGSGTACVCTRCLTRPPPQCP
jgi:hypothetical protein